MKIQDPVAENPYSFIETFSFKHNEELSIMGSNMCLANIRILNDLVKEGEEEIFLGELVVRDSQYGVLIDNCQKTNKSNKLSK